MTQRDPQPSEAAACKCGWGKVYGPYCPLCGGTTAGVPAPSESAARAVAEEITREHHDAQSLAALMDPEAFDRLTQRRRHGRAGADMQWAARRALVTDYARNLLAALAAQPSVPAPPTAAEALRVAAEAVAAVKVPSVTDDGRVYEYWRGYRKAQDECVEVLLALAQDREAGS